MASVTPNRAYPFPEGGDPIDVPSDIEALAMAVDVDVAALTANDPSVSTAGIIGEVRMFAGDTAPLTWMFCHGQAISRVTYAVLYSVLGNRYGAGDNTTTFNLPNLQATLPVGRNAGVNVPSGVAGFDVLGGRGGRKDTLLPTHNHPGVDHLHVDDHQHSGTTAGANARHRHGSGPFAFVKTGYDYQVAHSRGSPSFGVYIHDGTTDTDTPDHGHPFTTNYKSQQGHSTHTGAADRSLDTGPAGTDATNGNYPPAIALNFMIKVQ